MEGRRQEHRGKGTEVRAQGLRRSGKGTEISALGNGTGKKARQEHGDNKTGGKGTGTRYRGKGVWKRAQVQGYRGKGTCGKGIGLKAREQGCIQGQRHRSKGVRV